MTLVTSLCMRKPEIKLVKKKNDMKHTNEYSIRRTGKVLVKKLDLNRHLSTVLKIENAEKNFFVYCIVGTPIL